MRISRRGFTIVEILIIITVIGILSTVGIISYNRYRADARDTQKQVQLSVIAEALEKYYENNGEYPSCASLTQDPNTITANVLPGVDPANFVVPSSGLTNSMLCGEISDVKNFGYVGDGSTACASTTACAKYQLQYKKESDGTIFTLNSRSAADILTASAVTINAAGAVDCTNGFNGINLNWNGVSGASSYTVQRDTLPTFLATNPNFAETTTTTNSTLLTGLNTNTEYYVRIRAVASDGRYSYWSDSVNRSTLNPAINLNGTAGSFSATLNWTANSCANQYTVQRATDSGFSQNLVNSTYASSVLTDTYNGLAGGTIYYFRAKMITSSGYNGPWTSTTTVTPINAPPAAPDIAYVTTGTFEVSNTVSGAVYTATLVSGSGSATQSTVNGKIRFTLSNTPARFSVTAGWSAGAQQSTADYMERKPYSWSSGGQTCTQTGSYCCQTSQYCGCACGGSGGNCSCYGSASQSWGQCGCPGNMCWYGSYCSQTCPSYSCTNNPDVLNNEPGYTNSGSEWYKVS